MENTEKFINTIPDGSRVAIIVVQLHPSQVPDGEDFERTFDFFVEESIYHINKNFIDRPEKTSVFNSGIITNVTGGEFMYETFDFKKQL